MTRILSILTVTGAFVASCAPEVFAPRLPLATTRDITFITCNSATLTGVANICAYCGDSLIAKGMLWSIVQGVTIDNNEGFTEDTIGFGDVVFDNTYYSIVTELEGLQSETDYYVRAYAKNIGGIGYGDEKTFTTLPRIERGTITDSRDGTIYKTVKIYNQWWMAQNLNIGTMIDGSKDQADNEIIEKYCYENDPANCDTYGGLYQWNEMMAYNPPETVNVGTTQGLCLTGWHLPTEPEWRVLIEIAGGRNAAGKALKSWTSDWWTNGGIDALLFTGLPAGGRLTDDWPYFVDKGAEALFWTTTEGTISDITWPWFFRLVHISGYIDYGKYEHIEGLSVRCVRD